MKQGKRLCGGWPVVAAAFWCAFFVLAAGRFALAVGPYAVNGDGTVTDNATGLIWQRDDDGAGRNWQNALAYCEGLTLADQSDWRLPNIQELRTLVDYTRYSPAMDVVAFPNGRSSDYWSSTSYAVITSAAWIVYFGNGGDSNDFKATSYYVRCVRGGLSGVSVDLPLSVLKTGTGHGTVTSEPAGINCGGVCSDSFPSGASVTLTAVADSGSTFTGWSGGGCTGTGTCTVTMDAATAVTANFAGAPLTYTISGNAGAAGVVLGYTDGSARTATANDSGVYSFTVSHNWSGTVTPSKTGYTFSPASRAYTNVQTNQPAQNYTATAHLPPCDLNGDYKPGLAEAIYILQMLSGRR